MRTRILHTYPHMHCGRWADCDTICGRANANVLSKVWLQWLVAQVSYIRARHSSIYQGVGRWEGGYSRGESNTCIVSQSTSSCSLRTVRLPEKMALAPSTEPVVEKAQHEPHCTGHAGRRLSHAPEAFVVATSCAGQASRGDLAPCTYCTRVDRQMTAHSDHNALLLR